MKTTGRTPRWTFGLVVRKKPVKFAALALVLTAVLAVCLDPVLTALVRGAGIRGDATAIAVAALAIFFAVSVLASGLLLTVLSNLRLARMTPEAAQALFDRQCRFFWSRLYSLALGYVVWCVSWYFAFQYATTRPRSSFLVNLGIFCFSLAVLFQLITLPVEFNASRRALVLLRENGILYQDEAVKTRKVLSAAALTYVAGALSSILQLLRLIILTGGRRDRD